MNQFKYILAGLGIFIVSYIYFALSGAIIDNDTVAYISFAHEIKNGVFPHSTLYQPGVGFFIFFVNIFTGLDFFTSFRILNFLYGLGVILLILSAFTSTISKIENKFILIFLLTTSPFIALFSNFLYADIGFVFYTLLSLFFLSIYLKKRKRYLLFLTSFFIAISIFTKYNGLSILLACIMFLSINGFQRKLILGSIKEVIILMLFPSAYILFWKIYNGNLGGVEFNSYIKIVNIECMIQYLNINIISLYHLFLKTIFFSAHAKINHYLLIIPLIGLFILLIFYVKSQNKLYFDCIKNNNLFKLYYLFLITYLFAMIGIQSLNCVSEISIRIFLTPLIILHSLMIHYLVFIFNVSDGIFKKRFLFFLLLFSSFFNIYYLIEYNKEHEQFKLSKSSKKYSNITKFISDDNDIKEIYATPGFIRECVVLNKKLIYIKSFPYQSYYDYDIKIELTNSDYFRLIKERFSKLVSKQVLIIEFRPSFIKEYKDSLNDLNIISKDKDTYLFKKL